MRLLTSQRTVLLKKTIHAPPEAVLALVQDPNVLFASSPLVTNVTPDSTDPSNTSYTVTDDLSFAGLFNYQIQYKCRLVTLANGVNSQVEAGFGTRLKGQSRVKGGEHGSSELSEETVIETVFFMMPYVLKSFTAAHTSALEVLAARAEKRTSRSMNQALNVEPRNRLPSTPPLATMMAVVILYYISPIYPTALSVLIAVTSLTLYFSKASSDPYGLFHLSFNKIGADTPSPPKTEWLNMGYWKVRKATLCRCHITQKALKDTDIFPEACQALCNKLIHAARCQNGDHILDVGHGTGESLILLVSRLHPLTVTGITSLPAHHHRSRERIDRVLAPLSSPPNVDLYLGDAVCHHAQVGHPLHLSSPKSFNRILALDCAYHFNTRRDFLHQAYLKLTPGGRIALADICFDTTAARRSWAGRLLVSLFGLMPRQNIVSVEEYVAQMKDIGYKEVELDDITEHVFPGFVQFLKGRGVGWRAFGSVMEWYHQAGARFVIVSGSHQK